MRLIGIFASFSVPEVPSAAGFFSNLPTASNFAVQIIFPKGSYLTVITTQGNAGLEATARGLAVNWAIAEYHQLPT